MAEAAHAGEDLFPVDDAIRRLAGRRRRGLALDRGLAQDRPRQDGEQQGERPERRELPGDDDVPSQETGPGGRTRRLAGVATGPRVNAVR
jgi:hypothetical protein